MRVDKITLFDFIETLKKVHDSGAEYIDVVGRSTPTQDVITIEVRNEYIRGKLTEETLEQLI